MVANVVQGSDGGGIRKRLTGLFSRGKGAGPSPYEMPRPRSYVSDGKDVDLVPPFMERARLVLPRDAADRLERALGSIPPNRARNVVIAVLRVSAAIRRFNDRGCTEQLRIGTLLEHNFAPLVALDGAGTVDVIWLAGVAAGILDQGMDPRPTLAVFTSFLAKARSGALEIDEDQRRALGVLVIGVAERGNEPSLPLREGLEKLDYL